MLISCTSKGLSVKKVKFNWINTYKENSKIPTKIPEEIDYLEIIFGEKKEFIIDLLSELYESKLIPLQSFMDLLSTQPKAIASKIWKLLMETKFIKIIAGNIVLDKRGLEVIEREYSQI